MQENGQTVDEGTVQLGKQHSGEDEVDRLEVNLQFTGVHHNPNALWGKTSEYKKVSWGK